MAANNVPDSARAIVQNYLTQYGLGSLTGWAWNIYIQNGGGQNGIAGITTELPNTPQFKARFPAYDTLAKQGRAMSIDAMLQYEQTARNIFHAAGIPGGFYDQPNDFAGFMLNDVSVAELETRVKDAQAATINSPPDVRAQLKRLYGVDAGHLTAFFLDPKVAEPIIAQKFTASQIAAESGRTTFGQISRSQAEHLAQLGVSDQAAAQGFNKLAMEQGLFQEQVQGEGAITQDTQLAAQFEGNAAAQRAFEIRQAKRKAAFAGSSGFGFGREGIGGLAPSERGA